MKTNDINGCPIIEAHCANAERWIVLVKRGREYVTAAHNPGEPEWYWGHYFRGLKEAAYDYAERVERGY